MGKTRFKRLLSLLLCAMMVLSLMPSVAFAAETGSTSSEYTSETHDVFKHTESTLAPGVEQYINYAYAKDGKQMVYYVATADITRDDVVVQTSYLNQHEGGVLGMEKLTNQIAYANQKYSNPEDSQFISDYYNVVAGVNASFYNMTTGQPMGITYIDGVSFGTSSYDNFFAILKDGKTAVIDYAKNLGNYVDENGESTIWQASAGSQWLVRDGADVTASATGSYNTERHSRTCVGVTSDGKVVMMVLDGRQEPFSCGGTMHELAQIMLEAGCVAAINLDGGGSTTYAARPEGSDSVSVINRPSDGSERSISSGLIIASTAAPSNVFDHAVLTAENDFVSPGSTVNVSAVGVSPSGGAADLPENVTWALADTQYGTIENGVFVSNGTAGDVTVYLKLDDAVVGETTLHVLVPATIKLTLSSLFVSYGNTKELELTAYTADGLHKITLKDGDIALSLSDEALGTVSGLSFTAAQTGTTVTSGTITAYFVGHEDVKDELTVTLTDLPDTPVVVEDFEGDVSYTIDPMWPDDYISYKTEVVDSTTGKVHDGDKALAITLNGQSFGLNQYSGGYCLGYGKAGADGTIDKQVNLVGAKKLGLWIYVPEDSAMMYPQIRFRQKENTSVQVQHRLYDVGYATTEAGHTGWQYFEIDLQNPNDSGRAISQNYDLGDGTWYIEGFEIFTNSRTDNPHNTEYNYNVLNQQSAHGPCTFYIDTLTVEYFDNDVDRQNPTFDYIRASYGGMSDAADITGQTISSNVVSFTAKASDASAFDVSSAKAYIDGNPVGCTFDATTGIMTIGDTELADGVHTVKFEVADIYGNSNYVVRQLTVNAGSDLPTARLINTNTVSYPRYNTLILFNLEVDKIENIQSVSMKLNANNTSKWELDHISCVYGFTSSYSIDEVTNTATITITKTGNVEASGTVALAEIPLRMGTYTASSKLYPLDMKLSMELGKVSYTDGEAMFSMADVDIDSEVYGWTNQANSDIHKTHTGTALADKAATCTEGGYTGRTYCEVCSSVVDWGTTLPATGHSYALTDNVLKCSSCGDLYSGTWTDGKEYTDGVATADGWVDDSYYKNGVKLTGIQKVPAPDNSGEFYYDFGDNGVCSGKVKYTGFLEKDDGWYYIAVGTESKGWQYIDDKYYYFDPDTGLAWYNKPYYIYSQTYLFDEKGMLLNGIWHNDGSGTLYFYGPGAYKRTWAEIEGNTYYFDEDGHRKEGISWFYLGQSNNPPTWYEFTNDGALIRVFNSTGLWEYDGKLYYLVNGVNQKGLVLVDGDYYYFNSTDYTAVSGRYWVSNTNGLGIGSGYYDFDETTHKMIIQTDDTEKKNGLVEENGGLYYYVDGVLTYAGLIEIDGSYYYINSSCKAVTGHYWVYKTNGLITEGYYDFDETTHKMIVQTDDTEKKNGLVEENGGLYYYVDGVLTYAGLIEIDGSYYYINSSCKAVTGRYWVYKTNGLITEGYYEFDTDGKMIQS